MISYERCSGCQCLQISTFGMTCGAPFWCSQRNGTHTVASTTTRPIGYRTPEDGLQDLDRRVLANAPNDETTDDVLRLINETRYMNRGRWAAYVVRLGAATKRGIEAKES